MPEGHTVHRLALDHTAAFAGAAVTVSSPQGRFSQGAALVDGSVLVGVDAWGKHLFYRFAGERFVHVHLGLFGKWWPLELPPAPNGRAVRLRLVGASSGAELTGPTTCEILGPPGVEAVVARLGPDPIRPDADSGEAWDRLRRRKGPIGVAIMDQRVVAGVGNVFRAESLFALGIHPERPANTLSPEEWQQLWSVLQRMLRRGVAERRIVTVDPAEVGIPRSRIPRSEAHYVYKRLQCLRCGTPIRRWDLAGRWAYACETCQPPRGR